FLPNVECDALCKPVVCEYIYAVLSTLIARIEAKKYICVAGVHFRDGLNFYPLRIFCRRHRLIHVQFFWLGKLQSVVCGKCIYGVSDDATKREIWVLAF